jgi:exodeoxyribonuclease VII small subunit
VSTEDTHADAPHASDGAAASTFEGAMQNLEDCVTRLEAGDLTLEESLQVFERGIAASRACASLLDRSRRRVRVLVEKAGGELALEFLDPADEEALTAGPEEEAD